MSSRVPLAALLLAVGAVAQAAPLPPAAKSSPQAKALLAQMAAAENSLASFSGTVSITDTSGPGQSHQSQVVLKVKKPGLADVTVSSGGAPFAMAISDGTLLSLVDYDQKKYTQVPATGEAGLTQALSTSPSSLISFINAPASISQMFSDPHTRSVTLGPEDVVDGVTTQSIVATIQIQPGVMEMITLKIGRDDHLLRSIAFHVSQSSRSLSHTEMLTRFRTNPALTAADFAFTPPSGLTKVASVEDMQPPMYDPRLKVGADPFPFTAPGVDGSPVSLADYKGKVVLLDFWATWCGPCRGEMPNVVAAYNKYHPQGFDILGVSLDQANAKTTLTDFTKQNAMPWKQVYDGGFWQAKVAQQYGVQSIPFSLLIGKDGKIAAVGARGPALAPAIEAALAQK